MEFKEFLLMILSTVILAGCSKVNVSDLPSQGPGNQGLGDPSVPHTSSSTLKPASQKVDLILVIDNSASMYTDAETLGSKLDGFLQKLEGYSLDWQLCMVTTDYDEEDGKSISFVGNARSEDWILKRGDANISQKVIDTINTFPFSGGMTKDERGVASLSSHLSKSSSNHCYRPGAALSAIIISDEDERSVGGVQSLNPAQYYPIESIDRPENYVAQVQSALGGGSSLVAHVVHSIIVQPGDSSCFYEQNHQDSGGSPSFYGTFYNKLSSLTGGSVASICSKDFSQGLNVFAEQVQKSFQRIKLDCVPAAGWKATTSPSIQNLQAHAEGAYVVIDTQVTQDTVVNVQYTCQ